MKNRTKRRRYEVVVADPPWSFSDRLRMESVKRGAEDNYRTLTTKDVKALGSSLDAILKSDALLALWVPSALLTEGLSVLEAWGFKQKQVWTWVKTKKHDPSGLAFGMGRQFRGCTEHALIGTRGSPKPRNRSQRNVVLAPGLPHSQKPEGLQDSLELMYRGPFLELFARRARAGWTCVGNESPETKGMDVRDWLAGKRRRFSSGR